jgi:Asp-tRNA(Asn)/Glu-tRNA(Gln) amidotransferase A subunit family amidase
MTEEEREKLIEDMAQTIYVMLEVRDGYRDEYRLSREPLYVQRKYQNVARPTLVIAEEAISKDYRARIAELEAALKDLREAAYDVDEMDMPFSQRNEWGCCLAKADEALKGEK